MGYFPDGTPMTLQFFDQLDGEATLLGLGYDYEQATLWRTAPNLDAAIAVQLIPEPATCGLLLLGASALLFKRSRGAA
jgi:hypothetical protein